MLELDDLKVKARHKKVSLAQNTDVSQASGLNNSKRRRRVKVPFEANRKNHSMSNVEDRLSDYQKQLESRRAERQRAKEKEDMKDCTFQPWTGNSNHQKNRSYTQFFQDMNQFVQTKEAKLNVLRNSHKSQEDAFDFQPKITYKSSLITKKNSYCTIPSHERLFYASKSHHKSSSYLPGHSDSTHHLEEFTPSINQKSKNMSKRGSEYLYQDALRRMKKETPKLEFHFPGASKNSKLILINKFLASFKEMSTLTDINGDQQLNYIRFLSMLRCMGFTSKHRSEMESQKVLELWTALRNSQDLVTLEDLKVAMMAIMGYYQTWMNKGNFKLDKANAKKFHEQFALLFKSQSLNFNEAYEDNLKMKKKINRHETITDDSKDLGTLSSQDGEEFRCAPSVGETIRGGDGSRKCTQPPLSPQIKVDLKRTKSSFPIFEDANDNFDANISDHVVKRRNEFLTVKLVPDSEVSDAEESYSALKGFALRLALSKRFYNT